MRIIPLDITHLDAAAELSAARVRALREQAPDLPLCYGEPTTLLPLLQEIAAAGPGVAALEGERLVGFILAWRVPAFRGRPTVFSPEWANGVDPSDSRRIYEALYTRMAALWVEEGYRAHVICLLPHDRAALESWHWLGFGLMAADGVRSLAPIAATGQPDWAIGRAGPEDLNAVLRLSDALNAHMSAAPVFLPPPDPGRHTLIEQQLGDARYAHWLARRDGEAVGWLRIGPASDDACTIIRDPGTASITGAYVLPAVRGQGAMTALLDRALAWARAEGYTRCAVDFEPMNPPARRFWLRYFRLACLAVGRRV